MYYDLLLLLCRDFQERINRGVGGIAEITVEEKLVKRKWERRKTLYLVVKSQFTGITEVSSWVLKDESAFDVREDLAKQIVHNYFCFGLHKTYNDNRAKQIT